MPPRRSLIVSPAAVRQLNRLPAKVAPAVLEFMLGPLCDRPTVVGKPLTGNLAGTYSARQGAYRIIYSVDEKTVTVLRIDHRSTVYRTT